MAKRYYHSKEKITQKMTRDGLVEVNAVTGEETRISQRGQDFNLQKGREDVAQPARQQAHTEQGRRQPPPPTVSEQTTHNVQYGEQQADYRQETQTPQDMRYAVTQHSDMPQVAPTAPQQSYTAVNNEHTPPQTTKRHKQAVAEQSRLEENGRYSVDNSQSPQSQPSYSTPENTTQPAYTAQDTQPYTTQDSKPYEAPQQEIPSQSPTMPHTADIPYNPVPYNPAPTNAVPLSSYSAFLPKRHADEPVQNGHTAADQWLTEDIPQAETATPPTSRRSRLQYDQSQPTTAKQAKPTQHGTRYQQGFSAQEATSETPPTQTAEQTPIKAQSIHRTANAPVTSAAEAPQGSTAQTATQPTATKLGADKSRLQFSGEQPQAEPTAKLKQHGTKYQQGFSTQDKPPSTNDGNPSTPTNADTASTHTQSTDKPPLKATEQPSKAKSKQNRLQFSKDEQAPEATPDKKLKTAQLNADKVQTKLDKAREKLPSKRKPKMKRVFDDDKGKAKRKLKFEKEILPKGTQKPVPKPAQAANAMTSKGQMLVAGKLHQKVYEVEHENVGTKAAHRVEQAGETAFRGGKRITRSAYRFIKDKPYRTVAKLEKQATRANVKLAYQKSLQDNPKLKSSMLSRFAQKRKIKRQYAKAATEAKRAARTAKKTGGVIADATKAIAGFFSRHPALAGIIALILLLLIFIMTMFGSCSNMATGFLSSVVGSSYTAKDKDIDDSELYYTEWETDLQIKINNAERDRPGYDEYRYNVGDIGHNPFELMAYLTAKYQDFSYSAVRADLQAIFNEQYTLSFVEEIEVRYRTETHTDPDTGESYDVEVPYNWYILNVNLEAKSFTDVIVPRMNNTQLEMFGVYMQTKGNRQYLSNVFDVNWLPYVSSYYGYRIHPISGAKDYHKGIDIALPAGTQIKSGQDGRVTYAGYSGDYGYVVVIEDDKGLVSKYAHCNTLLVSVGQEVKKGDPIATVGSTGNSTGPHLHLEVIKNGQYLNPIYFAETGDDGSGYIPPGSPGGIAFPEYPGAPMGDGSYAALMEEAQKHLGKPYVFGSKGPNTFDCSGFVCWSLTKSGVKNIATNAQGLFNASTPVSAANAKPGDLIFFHSTYSTPNTVTHVGIYIGNGMMIHAGNPVSYASINTNYWQNHFYAFGRI